ncbi:restriction endonuclease subunit S [Corynebacterium matruchotii]|uniref:restriction endonuclease subunit S n=1 Tax=Corynebacterium matruchotii TaxID=43768 RepID=UPI0028E58AAB|nr:restriction endonuclease subunit S [Corynebacterium matruchotii]
MSEWPMVKLGGIARFVSGGTPDRNNKAYYLGQIPWISGADISDSGHVQIRRRITEEAAEQSATSVVESGTLLLVTRTSIGKIALAPKDLAFSQDITGIFPNDAVILRKYLESFIRSIGAEQLKTRARGVTIKGVNRKDVEELKIPLPPLGEQKRIAEILGEASKTIKDTEKIIHNVQGLKRSALRGILDNKSGEYVQLSQISSVQSGITKGRKVQNKITLMPTPYMAVSNVKAGYLDLSEVKQIDASEAEVNRYQLQAGDILLTEGGDPDKLGRGTIWRNEIPGAIHQNHIFRVRINPDSGFTSEALMAILESTESKGYFLRSAKQTTGISSINKRQLSATPIPVLGKVQIEELTNMWHKIDEVIELYHRKLSLLQELQKSLATRAFAGLL